MPACADVWDIGGMCGAKTDGQERRRVSRPRSSRAGRAMTTVGRSRRGPLVCGPARRTGEPWDGRRGRRSTVDSSIAAVSWADAIDGSRGQKRTSSSHPRTLLCHRDRRRPQSTREIRTSRGKRVTARVTACDRFFFFFFNFCGYLSAYAGTCAVESSRMCYGGRSDDLCLVPRRGTLSDLLRLVSSLVHTPCT